MGKIINRTRERSLESRRAQFMKEFEESKSNADYYKRRMQFQWKQHMLTLELLDSVQEALGLGPGSHGRIIPAIAQLKDAAQANAKTISEVESTVQQAYRDMQSGKTPLPHSAIPDTNCESLGQGQFEFDTLIIEVNGSTSKLIAKKGAEVVHTSTDKIKGHGIPDNLTLLLMYGGFKAVSEPVRIGDWSPKSHE